MNIRLPTQDEVRSCAEEADVNACRQTTTPLHAITFLPPDRDTCGLVLATLRSNGDPWNVTKELQLAQLVWTTSFRGDLAASLRSGCIVSRFPWSFALGHKDELYATLKETKFPFVPEYYLIPRDLQALRETLQGMSVSSACETPLWVMKPPRSGGAKSVRILHASNVLDVAMQCSKRPMIIQRSVPHLSLIDGRKFHLRVFALIVDRGSNSLMKDMQVLVYREGLVMMATERFDLLSSSALVHVTNNRVQYADHRGMPPANWHIQQEFRQYVQERYGSERFEILWSHIKRVLGISIGAVINKCLANEMSSVASASRRTMRCFQLLGADICVAKNFTEAWLLELNTVPALWANLDSSKDCEKEFLVSAAVVRDLLRIVLAPPGSSPTLGNFELAGPNVSQCHSMENALQSILPCWSFCFLFLEGLHCASQAGCNRVNALIAGHSSQNGVKTEPKATNLSSCFNYAGTLAQYALDAIVSHLEWSGSDCMRIMHIGCSNSRLGEYLQLLPYKFELCHWNPALLGSQPPEAFVGQRDISCVVDDSVIDRQSRSISSRILRNRCCEIAKMFGQDVEGLERPALYILFSLTQEAHIIAESFDIIKSVRLHLNEDVFWLHIACKRTLAAMGMQLLQQQIYLEALPDWAAGPAAQTPFNELATKLTHPDTQYKWSSVVPPGRLGNRHKLDSLALEAGLLGVQGIAQKPTFRSKGLVFLDLYGPDGEQQLGKVQIKCDAEWLLPDMMLTLSKIEYGDLVKVEGIIIRRLRGGGMANLLALKLWRTVA